MGRHWHNTTACAVALGFASSCAEPSSDGSSATDSDGTSSTLTYYRDVKPILDAKCTGCHREGAVAPFDLRDPDQVVGLREVIGTAVHERTMPPWPPAPGCTDYVADRSLSAEQIDTLGRWVDEGAPLGSEDDEGEPLDTGPSYDLSRVDHTLSMATDYTPAQGIGSDDYRCFVIDWPVAESSYLTGLRFNPGERRVVHHGIVFVAGPEHADAVEGLDAADPGPGYSCFGGPEVPAGWLGVWVPGTSGSDFPADTGVRVEPGSKVVLQIHYSTTAGPLPDRTTIDVKVDPQVEREAWIQPWMDPTWFEREGLFIPAGAPDVRVSSSLDPVFFVGGGEPLVMHTVGLHMHLLGTAGRVTLERGDGTEDCLLDIPNYDFSWQGAYGLAEPRVLELGDRLRIECQWDNSPENQPVLDGTRVEPLDTQWGEGTRDEMCLGAFYLSTL